MITGLGDTQKSMLNILLYSPEGASIDELVQKLDITRNAVRQHLAALEREQLIQRSGQRPTGRRPELLYTLSDHGKASFPKQYPLLARLLIERIIKDQGSTELSHLMREMGRHLASSIEHRAPLNEENIVSHMNKSGYEANVFFRSNDREIHAHNCVFHDLAAEHPEVCDFDLAFLESLGKRRVEHSECIVRGGKRCTFRFLPDEE
jgi:predicted ArsR family transcriptional regulator